MNKTKTTWNVIRENVGKTPLSNELTKINLETRSTDDINKTAHMRSIISSYQQLQI
jgi:hypothetical protein